MPTMAGPAAKTDLTTFLDTSGCTVSKDTVGLGDEDSLGDLPDLPYQVVGKLYQLHQEQDSIRREAELLENPLLRLAVTANKVAARKEGRRNKVPGVLVVWGGGTMGELGELMRSQQ